MLNTSIDLNRVNDELADELGSQSFTTTMIETTIGGMHAYKVTLTTGGQTVFKTFPSYVFKWSVFDVDALVAHALLAELTG